MIGVGIATRLGRLKGKPFGLLNEYRERVLADGGIVEGFLCAIAALRLPGVNIGQFYFDQFEGRVIADGGVVEAEQCTVNAINNINIWELY